MSRYTRSTSYTIDQDDTLVRHTLITDEVSILDSKYEEVMSKEAFIKCYEEWIVSGARMKGDEK